MKTLYDEEPFNCFVPEPSDLSTLLPYRKEDSHKGDFGRVLIVAGSKNMCGAAFLAAKAAYLAGAGLVRIFTCEENRVILQERLPEAVLNTYTQERFTDQLFLDALSWASVLAIGPGLGCLDIAQREVFLTLSKAEIPCVLDADALNILSAKPELFSLLQKSERERILTPHIGEMSRLTGLSADELKKNRLKAASAFADRTGAILVMKDARTVTAFPHGNLYINMTGNNGMATGGSGDVLTGLIAGLLAQGASGADAAVAGVLLHGLSGDRAAKTLGVRSLLASDLLSCLPAVLREADEAAKSRIQEEASHQQN